MIKYIAHAHPGLTTAENKSVAKKFSLKNYQYGVLFRLKSFWIGAHYSNKCKRLCVNIIPCLTFWIAAKDGLPPDITKM